MGSVRSSSSSRPLWELTKDRPRSISGVKLDGEKLVRLVYIDESGISVNESVAVVAGVVIDADSQWKAVERHLSELTEKIVREEDREGFVFHATDLFHRSGEVFGNRKKYPIEHCHEALKALLNVPAKFRLSVVYGYVHKRPRPSFQPKFATRGTRTEAGLNHSMAFSLCAVAAETFMQNNAGSGEIATLVAENNTDTRHAVKAAYKILKGKDLKLKGEIGIFELLSEVAPGRLPLTKIIDTIHLVEKHEASLLQIADACALVIRYCLEEKSSAQDFINLFSLGHPEKLIPKGETPEKTAGYNVLVFSPPS